MKRLLYIPGLVIAVLLGSSGIADANLIDWLENLSGPGPFRGVGYSSRLFCISDQATDRVINCVRRDNDPNIRFVSVLTAEYLWTGDTPRFDDVTGDRRRVNLWKVEPGLMVRIHPILDVGAGAGFMRFSGEGFDAFSRFTFTPVSVSVVPLAWIDRRWNRFVRLRIEGVYEKKGFTGADFGNAQTKFSTDHEFLTNIGVIFDVASLWP